MPQRRAIFDYLNLKKRLGARSFYTFDFKIGSVPQRRANFDGAFPADPSAPAALAT